MIIDLLAQVDAGHQAASNLHLVVLQVLRWMHFFFGIVWLGTLYYFNFVQGPGEKALDAAQKKVVVPNFRGRAMWWFRWGAMLTLLTGLSYLLYQEFVATQRQFSGWLSFGPEGSAASNAWILFGATLGTIMWANVWFVIWPRQQVLIAAVAGQREKPADFDAMAATAARFSKINTYLSFPMLFGMGGRMHLPVAKGWGEQFGWWAAVILVGVGIAVHVVKHAAPRVGLEFLPEDPASGRASSR